MSCRSNAASSSSGLAAEIEKNIFISFTACLLACLLASLSLAARSLASPRLASLTLQTLHALSLSSLAGRKALIFSTLQKSQLSAQIPSANFPSRALFTQPIDSGFRDSQLGSFPALCLPSIGFTQRRQTGMQQFEFVQKNSTC
jgi:hypothetical protein